MDRHFASYDEFFLHYLRQHRDPRNRLLHACGTVVGLAIAGGSFAFHHPWFALLFLPAGYGFAWFGHFFVEHNHPATWEHPWWSFCSDFHMLGLMLIGRVGIWLKRAEEQEPLARSQHSAVSRSQQSVISNQQ